VTCLDVRRELAAYVDGELSGAQRLLLASHLHVCRSCQAEAGELRTLGEVLREAVAGQPVPLDDLRGLAGGVISRIGAENAQSWTARWSRAFDDWRWVAIGSGACSAAFVLVTMVFAILYSPTTQARQLNEKVGTLYVMTVPENGRGGPVMLEYGESLQPAGGDHRYSVPASFSWKADQLLAFALDASLRRHGDFSSFYDLSREDREEVDNILKEIASLRTAERPRRPAGVAHVSGMHLWVDEVVTASGL
jgi:hypothetical protein